MLASKRQLQVEVENLEARVQMIAAAKATSNYQFDDSRLGRRQGAGRRACARGWKWPRSWSTPRSYYHDEIPLDKAAPENIVEQVTEHFAAKTPTQVAGGDEGENEGGQWRDSESVECGRGEAARPP